MLKKVLSVILVSVLVMGIAGCGKTQTNAKSEKEPDFRKGQDHPTAEKHYRPDAGYPDEEVQGTDGSHHRKAGRDLRGSGPEEETPGTDPRIHP